MQEKRFYQFGEFRLDATAKVLLRGDQPVQLTRKAVETLLVLVENPGQVVTKEDLLKAVWPDRVVEEANLTQNIAVIRRALAAERGTPAYIETFAGRGYRIVGPVRQAGTTPAGTAAETPAPPVAQTPPPPTPPAPPTRRPSRPTWLYVVSAVAIAAAATGWLAYRWQSRPPDSSFHVIPVTRLPGIEYQPALSPDGGALAFVWAREGVKNAGVWVQRTGQGAARQVTPNEGHYSSPAWSPDGKSLALLRAGPASTEVLIYDLDAVRERRIASFPSASYLFPDRLLDWSPDGRFLVVARSDPPGKPPGLFLIAQPSGDTTRLTQPEKVVGGDLDPRFSPDGAAISFVRHLHRMYQELFVVPVAGGAPRQLTDDRKQISGHDWSPNGKAILFASDREGEFRLWRLQPAVSEPARTLRSTGIYGEFPMQLSLARKSGAFVYSTLRHDRNIWRLDLQQKTWSRLVASSSQDASPQLSPRGDRLCFRSDRTGEDQLWLSNADGSEQTQFTHGQLFPSVGRWAPDGSAIVFNNSSTGEIFLAPLGASARGLKAAGYHPVFSPDGKWIYAGSMTAVLRIPAQGGEPVEIARTRAMSLGVSPDGAHVYFVREPNDSTLWRVSTATGEIVKALDGLAPGCTSCWAVSAAGIYYLGINSQSLDSQTLYFLPHGSDKPRLVLEYPEPLYPLGSGPFSLSPDDRYLVTVRVDASNSDVMRVESFALP